MSRTQLILQAYLRIIERACRTSAPLFVHSFSMPDEVSAWAHSSAFSSNPNPWMPANLALREGSCQGLAPACISYLDDSSDVGSCPICRLKVSGAVSAPDTGMAASPQLRDERNHPTAADLGLTKAPHRIRTLAATQAAITKGRPSSATRAFAAPRQPPPADAAPPAQAAPAPPQPPCLPSPQTPPLSRSYLASQSDCEHDRPHPPPHRSCHQPYLALPRTEPSNPSSQPNPESPPPFAASASFKSKRLASIERSRTTAQPSARRAPR